MNRPASLLLSALLVAASISHPSAQMREAGSDARPVLPKVYRVELIVFEHRSGRSDRLWADQAADFTDHSDPLLVARAYRRLNQMLEAGGPLFQLYRSDRAGPNAARLIGPNQAEIAPLPDFYAASSKLSGEMAKALLRLENSDRYRPLTWRGWFQTAERNRQTAELRIHAEPVVAWLKPAAARALEQNRAPATAAASGSLATRRSSDS
ncbi:MAG: hypothetical protein LC637_02170, partial [Xanthomonadaceae bacterium]|nr:hypothetical protein [Xanthomonadaceae bacterium]